MEYQIRLAKKADAKAVHDIYGAYVSLDHVTFTVENPDIGSYRRKIITTLEKYPFLIAESDEGKVPGLFTARRFVRMTHINGMWNGRSYLRRCLSDADTIPNLFDSIISQYRLTPEYFKLKDHGMVLISGFEEKAAIKGSEKLNEAY